MAQFCTSYCDAMQSKVLLYQVCQSVCPWCWGIRII